MAIIQRDPYGGEARTYRLNLAELCYDTSSQYNVPMQLSKELRDSGKVTLTREELLRIRDILNSMEI